MFIEHLLCASHHSEHIMFPTSFHLHTLCTKRCYPSFVEEEVEAVWLGDLLTVTHLGTV